MRPTGFGHRSPNEATADYIYPVVNRDGRSLDMGYKTISDQRRELYYIHKIGAERNMPGQVTLDLMPGSVKDLSARKSSLQGSHSPYSSTKNVRKFIAKVGEKCSRWSKADRFPEHKVSYNN